MKWTQGASAMHLSKKFGLVAVVTVLAITLSADAPADDYSTVVPYSYLINRPDPPGRYDCNSCQWHWTCSNDCGNYGHRYYCRLDPNGYRYCHLVKGSYKSHQCVRVCHWSCDYY